MKPHLIFLLALWLAPWAVCPAAAETSPCASGDALRAGFENPPPSSRPWVYWFWINGNISKQGITADLEALQKQGIGGVLWMEVSGQAWAPDGKVAPLSPAWHDAFQWAIRECRRLGLQFDATLDFGYGSGGPHITPENSMQKIVWSEKEVEGGKPVSLVLEKPPVEKKLSAWLRPGAQIDASVVQAIEHSDSYRDVAVLALPLPASPQAPAFRIPAWEKKSGLQNRLPWENNDGPENRSPKAGAVRMPPAEAVTPLSRVVDLTGRMDREGRLQWDAPSGKWLVIRFGHASNFKMTRPCPQAAVGLECDRLSRGGIETHFDALLKKIIAGAGDSAGSTLSFAHIDSWEAGGQNWSASFPDEFRARRGYDLRPWIPVLTGRVVGSEELSERFLWDVRATASELIHDNYALRLRQLIAPAGMKLSIEAYGNLCIDDITYAGAADMPMSEFWAMGDERFPAPPPRGGYERSSKVMASAAHTYGRPIAGAESFTSGRAWQDHPFLLKAMGDRVFSRGINRLVMHLSAHQAYDNMIPGLTHRRWGQHFQRHNTWWSYSRPWLDYLARSQYLLQQGQFVADVCYCFGEGAPLGVDEMTLDLPDGYDYDFCSAEMLLQMKVREGRLVLPSGMSYRYLVLPGADRLSLPLAKKARELVAAGGRVASSKRPRGTPGLTNYPDCDAEVEKIAAALWDTGRVESKRSLAAVLKGDGLPPDFDGQGLLWIHRWLDGADVYFVANPVDQPRDVSCSFRVAGRAPELWDAETGAVRALPEFTETCGGITVPLHFEATQSWFVVFPKAGARLGAVAAKNFAPPRVLRALTGPWQVSFDPAWGGPKETVALAELTDWSKHPDPRIHYYSGTAVYRKSLELSDADLSGKQLTLALGKVEVMARVKLNGLECGIAWKPPYRVDIGRAARAGKNELTIDVVNLWINRMIGDEQLPDDCHWLNSETLAEWPEWFTSGKPRPSGRYTFTTCKHYRKDSPLVPSGLLGPVTLQTMSQ